MKKFNLFNIASKLFGLAMVMAVLVVFYNIFLVSGIMLAAVSTGAVVSADTVDIEAVKAGSPYLDTDYISKKVTEMKPASTPLDTIMRNIGTAVAIKSFVSDYYAVDSRPIYDTVHVAFATSGDGQLSYDLQVHDTSMWTPDDTLMAVGVLGADSLDLICYVCSKNTSNGTIKIQPLNGPAGSGTTAGKIILPAAIPINTRLVRMGTAKNELDAQNSAYAIVPVRASNYMQIFMAQVEEGILQREHSKEVPWDFTDYEAQNIFSLKTSMENSYLFGYKYKFYDVDNNKERYATGGVTRYITKALTYGTGGADRTIDNATFVDWTKSIFTGNSGSDQRVFFGGDSLTAALLKVDTVVKQIEAKNTEVKWGITFNKIETNFGILLYKHHPMFELAGWGEKGLVLDMQHIEKHVYKPLEITKLDLVTSGQRYANAVVLREVSGIITRYPDCHAVVSPKA